VVLRGYKANDKEKQGSNDVSRECVRRGEEMYISGPSAFRTRRDAESGAAAVDMKGTRRKWKGDVRRE
jgi:hypothetical protein